MSDQNTSERSEQRKPSVASKVKEKDPKRVAAGKRLGAISKQVKEAKREALRLERQSVEMEAKSNEYILYLVGALVIAGATSYLYLKKDKVAQTLIGDKKESPTNPEEPFTPTTQSPKRKSKRIFGE